MKSSKGYARRRRKLGAHPAAVTMSDRETDALRQPKIVLDPGVVVGHILPSPGVVVEHVGQSLKVPLVGNQAERGTLVYRTIADDDEG